MNNDNIIMIQSEWLSPKPEPRGCLCCTATWWYRHRGSKTPSPFPLIPFTGWSTFFGSRNVNWEMQTGISAAQGTVKLASLLPCLLRVSHCGVGCKAEPLPEGWAGEHRTRKGDILLTPPVLTTGTGYTGKGHRTPMWC